MGHGVDSQSLKARRPHIDRRGKALIRHGHAAPPISPSHTPPAREAARGPPGPPALPFIGNLLLPRPEALGRRGGPAPAPSCPWGGVEPRGHARAPSGE